MTNKEKFLINNVGFHSEDLSLIRQIELETVAKELGVSKEWILLALSKDTLEGWEKWGFNLLKKPEFKSGIDRQLKLLYEKDEKEFKNANSKKKAKKLHVSYETFMKCWNGVKAQGFIYTTEQEAEALGLTDYWAVSNSIIKDKVEEIKNWVNIIIAADEQPDDEDIWLKFCLSVQHTVIVKIKTPERTPSNKTRKRKGEYYGY